MKKLVFFACVFGLYASAARALPTDGFSAYSPTIYYNYPYNLPLSARHSGSWGSNEHFWVYAYDKPFEQGNTTKPRVEGYNNGDPPRWTSGVWQFEGDLYVPSPTSGACMLQLFGGTTGATSFMLWALNGNLCHFDSPVLLSDVWDEWHQVNLIHDCNNHKVYCYIDNVLEAYRDDNDAGQHPVHYFKYGVYQQPGATTLTESYWNNKHWWYRSSIPSASSWWFPSNTENWRAGHSSSTVSFTQTSPWTGGVAYADQTGTDCYWYGPTTYFSGNSVGYPCVLVAVYPQGGTTSSHDMQLRWITTADQTWNDAKSSQVVSYNKQGGWTAIALGVNTTAFTSGTINQYRLDFDTANTQTWWIVDYILTQPTFVTLFNSGSDGWGVNSSLTAFGSGSPGTIYTDQTGINPYITGPATNFRGAANDALEVRVCVQNSSVTDHAMKAYWQTPSEPNWSESRATSWVNFSAANDTWTTVTIPIGANYACQPVTKLRINMDPQNNGQRYVFDYINVVHKSTAY